MKRKDFYIGQIVCVKQFATSWREEELQQWRITKIGKLYVTAVKIDSDTNTDYAMTRQFSIEYGSEKDNCRNEHRLYLSEQHIKDLEEVYILKSWFRNEFNNYSNDCKYSLEALKEAKKILEDSVK